MSAPVPADYWVASSTVAPVLALALVVEARAVLAKWTPESPPLLFRVLASVWWFVPLASFFYLEPVMLDALRGQTPPAWVPVLFGFAVSAALANLALTPALDFAVRANADLLAALLSRHPIVRVRFWRLARLTRRAGSYRAAMQAAADEMARALDDLDESRARVDAISPPGKPDKAADDLRASISAAQEAIRQNRANTLSRLARAEQTANEHAERLDAVRLKVAQVTEQQRQDLRTVLRGEYPDAARDADEK